MQHDNKTVLTVETIVKAPIEKVWQYWTLPEHITKWNAANDDWHTPHAINNVVEGGKFESRMESKDGKMGFDFSGTYTKVEKLKNLEYTLEDDRKVKISFITEDRHVKIIESFEAESQNSLELQKTGWQAILSNFKKYVESL